ncbi:Uncharacterised protein [Mannheimia haemolytica]|uniref:Uncharacterized protein n=1 Tax=Mannheimia haemolytica TaxID=75985 RepID=A0A448T8A4_MANHA|nr:hypothetical protein [Mannheimia haemolytica]ODQ39148.1 hypothetical protein BHC25_00660 [Mannheimia haemolytica]VEI76213.1 Uncharacterised protein [Mannheimia haemolytica]
MKLTKQQEQFLLAEFENGIKEEQFVELTIEQVQQLRIEKRAEFIKNKKIIDEVFYDEMAYS